MCAGAVASLSPPSNRSWETAVLGGALKMSPSEQGRKDGKASIPPTSTLLRDAVQLPRNAAEDGLHPREEGALWLADGRDGPKAGGGTYLFGTSGRRGNRTEEEVQGGGRGIRLKNDWEREETRRTGIEY